MIVSKIKHKLMESWGAPASSMQCIAWVKYIDPSRDWACYIYALNPWDEDEIACIICDGEINIYSWSLKELYESYNHLGEHPVIDTEYRHMNAGILYKKLIGRE